MFEYTFGQTEKLLWNFLTYLLDTYSRLKSVTCPSLHQVTNIYQNCPFHGCSRNKLPIIFNVRNLKPTNIILNQQRNATIISMFPTAYLPRLHSADICYHWVVVVPELSTARGCALILKCIGKFVGLLVTKIYGYIEFTYSKCNTKFSIKAVTLNWSME